MSVQFPLYLMALSTTSSQNSQWSKGQAQVPAQVTVHPDSAGGLPDRGFGWLESAIASMPVQVLHDLRPRRDVALMAKGGHMRARRNANLLARARATDIGGGGALYDEPVRITR